MKLNQEAVLEYQEIFSQTYGEEISYADAEEEAQNLLTLFQVLLKK